MEVSGVFISCETLVMSSVFIRSLFMRASTARESPRLMFPRSVPRHLSSYGIKVVLGTAPITPAAIFSAELLSFATDIAYHTAPHMSAMSNSISSAMLPTPMNIASSSTNARTATTERHMNGSLRNSFAARPNTARTARSMR